MAGISAGVNVDGIKFPNFFRLRRRPFVALIDPITGPLMPSLNLVTLLLIHSKPEPCGGVNFTSHSYLGSRRLRKARSRGGQCERMYAFGGSDRPS